MKVMRCVRRRNTHRNGQSAAKLLYTYKHITITLPMNVCSKCGHAKVYKRKICQACRSGEQRKPEGHANVNLRLKKSVAALLRSNLEKQGTTMSYIGCNVPYLREWIEYNRSSEMTWDNYGSDWSIRPVLSACWHWTNLWPHPKTESDPPDPQIVIEKLKKFKEEGSTTKWFSKDASPFEI